MASIEKIDHPTEYVECDVALVGAGIMSATLALLLSELDPDLKLVVLERLAQPAQESSSPWNNAGTGHGGLCELNYSVEQADGSVDVSKAIKINEQLQVSRQLWAHLVANGTIKDPATFINSTSHMSFVTGEANAKYMRTRWETLKQNVLFESMQFSDQASKIAEWAPLLIEGRQGADPLGCTWDPTGTDVNFGALTRHYIKHIAARGATVEFNHEVTDVSRSADGTWLLKAKHTGGGHKQLIKAKRLFIGAGGYALHLLQKANLPEVAGYGLFPISGKFLMTSKPEIVSRHQAKVYGKAAVGAPPMSVPHLDTRVIDGDSWVLFGPFAGETPKYLKEGSYFDFVSTLRPTNIKPMLQVAKDNLDLVKYLVQQVILPPPKQEAELRAFYPNADISDWSMITAGQRAQIIKPDENGNGTLQFGTETVFAADDTVAAVLGASPGASTAVPIMLGVLERCFADRLDGWRPRLLEMIPTWGKKLSDDPDLARATMARTAEALGTVPPQ